MDKNELLTFEDAKRLLGVSRTQMYRYTNRGELHPVRLNQVKQKQPVYFYRREIERFILSRIAIAS